MEELVCLMSEITSLIRESLRLRSLCLRTPFRYVCVCFFFVFFVFALCNDIVSLYTSAFFLYSGRGVDGDTKNLQKNMDGFWGARRGLI